MAVRLGIDSLQELPYMEEMFAVLRSGEIFNRNLTGPELKGLMDKVIVSLLQNQDPTKKKVALRESPNTTVEIENGIAKVKANAHILDSQAGAVGDLVAKLSLCNSTVYPNELALVKPGVIIQVASTAIGAGMEKMANATLARPNIAFAKEITEILLQNNLKPTGMGLHFNPDSLGLTLKAEPLPTQK